VWRYTEDSDESTGCFDAGLQTGSREQRRRDAARRCGGLSFGEHGLGRFGEAVTSFSVFCFFCSHAVCFSFLFHPSFSYVQREREREIASEMITAQSMVTAVEVPNGN
jgi:hypothetical protein